MKWQEVIDLHQEIVNEVGGLATTLVEEKAYSLTTGGKRLAGEPYRWMPYDGFPAPTTYLTVKFRDRSRKVVARYLHQAIAEILWPNIPYWKHRWYGLVMAQPDDFPKGVKIPEDAQSRSRLLTLTIAQVKRSHNGHQ